MISDFGIFIFVFLRAWVKLGEALMSILTVGVWDPEWVSRFDTCVLEGLCRLRGIPVPEDGDD